MSASRRPKTATLALTPAQEYPSLVGSPLDGDRIGDKVVQKRGAHIIVKFCPQKDACKSYSNQNSLHGQKKSNGRVRLR